MGSASVEWAWLAVALEILLVAASVAVDQVFVVAVAAVTINNLILHLIPNKINLL